MELDKRMTIMVLSVLLIAVLVGLNFEKFTGKYVSGEGETVLSKIYVSTDPSVVKMDNPTVEAGKKVYFTVEIGSEGCFRDMAIYRKSGGVRIASLELDQNCGGNKCRPDRVTWADWRVQSDWSGGEYCARVLDYATNKYLTPGACFTVK